MQDDLIVTFFRMIPEVKPPMAPDKSAFGTAPTRAYRYCEAPRSASAYGWVFTGPLLLDLLFDGHRVLWRRPLEDEAWEPLDAIQYPGYADVFDARAPEDLKGFSPPLASALLEPGTVQIWTGFFAAAAPGWSLLVRPPANIPVPGWFVYEGIVDPAAWMGPLFANIRIPQTGRAVRIGPDVPLFQVQPVPKAAYAEETLRRLRMREGFEGLSADDWEAYRRSVVRPNTRESRPRSLYARQARRGAEG